MQLFATAVNELLASEMFTRNKDEYNNENFAKLTLKKAYQQDAGADYFVTFHVTEDNGAGVFKMNVSKQDAVITDPPVANNKPTLKGIPLRTGAGSGVQKVKIINSKLIYTTINETACLNWSWATEEQKNRCGESGWGNFKPKYGDVGEIITESKHCNTGVRVIIIKMGEYYVPVEDDALVFENSHPDQ
jgi:hypothetical protein